MARELVCRDAQLRLLRRLLPHKDCYLRSVHVHGPPSTGKTSALRSVLEGAAAAHIDCKAQLRESSVCAAIAEGLGLPRPSPSRHARSLEELSRAMWDWEQGEGDTAFVVMDHADRANRFGASLVPGLMRLAEASRCQVCVVFVTNGPGEALRSAWGCCLPVQIRFPAYTAKELVHVVRANVCRPRGVSEAALRKLLRFIIEGVQPVKHDLRECVRAVRMLLPRATDLIFPPARLNLPLAKRLVRDLNAGMSAAGFTASDVADKVASKRLSGARAGRKRRARTDEVEVSSSQSVDASAVNASEGRIFGDIIPQLPTIAKYVLLASFLAAYNPARLDSQTFGAEAGPRRKRRRARGSSGKLSQLMLGPRAFSLSRMMAIFDNIYDELDSRGHAVVHTLTSSLVHLRLLSQVDSKSAKSDVFQRGMRLRCNVGFDDIQALSKSLQFQVENYLYDPSQR